MAGKHGSISTIRKIIACHTFTNSCALNILPQHESLFDKVVHSTELGARQLIGSGRMQFRKAEEHVPAQAFWAGTCSLFPASRNVMAASRA
jgi:hypothetical protein